jgi:simple sugar transport system permease protein
MAFYGIVVGLISVGNPLAAIPASLFFGGMTIGGRYAQGKFQMAFGVDYALLGILMIVLISLQFFYHYKIVRVKKPKLEPKGGS